MFWDIASHSVILRLWLIQCTILHPISVVSKPEVRFLMMIIQSQEWALDRGEFIWQVDSHANPSVTQWSCFGSLSELYYSWLLICLTSNCYPCVLNHSALNVCVGIGSFYIVLGNGGNISKNRTGKVFVYKQTFCYLNTPNTETKKPFDSEPTILWLAH